MFNLTGQQFGNYRLTRHLGTGGFGEVYLGTHIHLQREAAIKLLLKLDAQEVELFHTEAQIIARLVHPHIVTLFDYDVAGETPFIVMMYAQQGTMRERHRPGRRAPLAEVVKYITQAADGLQFAHDQRVLHRDIKPANMLLGPSGQLLLSDFGIAVMWSGTHPFGTQNALGTHGYMAPEQYQGHPRPASDQYALAITAYEWLSGTRPMADAPLGLGMLQLARPEIQIPAIRSVVPHLPTRLDDVLQRALSNSWQARFHSVHDFAEELARAASSGDPTTYVPPIAPTQVAYPNTVLLPTRSQQEMAYPALHGAVPTQGWDNSVAPPPPPTSMNSYTHLPESNPIQYPIPITPTLAPMPLRVQRPLALPVTRAKNWRTTWAWTVGYTAFLLLLNAPLVALLDIYGKPAVTPAGWAIAVGVLGGPLVALLLSVLCGALLGRWRGSLVSLLVTSLFFLSTYLLNPFAFAPSSRNGAGWTNYLSFGILPVSAFVLGWIYERRRYASFGKSFLSMLIGISLIIITFAIFISIASSSSSADSSSSSITTSIATYLTLAWCILLMVIAPLALLTTGLEVVMHKMVSRKAKEAKEGKE